VKAADRLRVALGVPSLGAAFSLVGVLVFGALVATISLIVLEARELEETAVPIDVLARIRHGAVASAIFDRQALIAPEAVRARTVAEARLEHERVRAAIGSLENESNLTDEERRLYEDVRNAWRRRVVLAEEAFRWPAPLPRDADGRWASYEELAAATHGFNDRLQSFALAMQESTRLTARSLKLLALGLAFFALVAVGGGGLFLRGTVLRPLRRIVEAEERVASGRLDVSVPVRGLAELRALATNFNAMVAALRARADEARGRQALLARRERTLHRQNRELASANAELDAFAYAASHDLRAPLRGIESMARFLWEDVGEKLDPEARDKLDRIRRAARRLHQLIDSLFEVARAGRELDVKEEVSLADCLDDALAALEGPIRESGAEVVVDGELPTMTGDPTRLAQVLQNLVGNAVKYSAGPGRKPRVEIGGRLEDDGAVVALWVKDNGIGIPEDQHRRIFQLFRRLHREGEYEGTGVGLSIVERIVHAHGGAVSVESKPGEGATFTVRLPRQPPPARQAPREAEPPPPEREAA